MPDLTDAALAELERLHAAEAAAYAACEPYETRQVTPACERHGSPGPGHKDWAAYEPLQEAALAASESFRERAAELAPALVAEVRRRRHDEAAGCAVAATLTAADVDAIRDAVASGRLERARFMDEERAEDRADRLRAAQRSKGWLAATENGPLVDELSAESKRLRAELAAARSG